MQRAVTGGDALDEGTTEGSVSKPERLAVAAVGSKGEGILSRLAKEEECEGREVKDGLCMGLIMILEEAGDEGLEDSDVDWPHPGGGGIHIGPGLEEGLKAEDTSDKGLEDSDVERCNGCHPARDLGGPVGRTPDPQHVRLPPCA